MTDKDTNPLIHSLMRLRKHCCGGVSAADMTTNTRTAKDNAEFQKLIRAVKALITERDKARRLYLASTCSEDEIIHEMKRYGWDCFKENSNA
jgi:hypothetical protein